MRLFLLQIKSFALAAQLTFMILQVMEFTIIDTHGDDDRNFSEVLEAEGLAEFVHSIAKPNNAPPVEVVEVVEHLDDSCKY